MPKNSALLALLLICLVLWPAQGHTRAQVFDIPSCTLPDGTTVIPVIRSGNLVLVNLRNGDTVKVIETDFSPRVTSTILVRGWTPNCVNVFITIRGQVLVAWNVLDGRRLGQVDQAAMDPATLVFSPDNDYIFARPYRGLLLWQLSTGKQYLLSTQGVQSLRVNRGGAPTLGLTWDLERGQLLAVLDERPNGVTAIDLNTGTVAAFYPSGLESGNTVTYQIFGDELLVMTYLGETVSAPAQERLVIYSRASGVSLTLNLAGIAGGRTRPRAYTETERSPDGRFLAVSNKDIYLFDLSALGASPHVPVRRIEVPEGRYPRLRFNAAGQLEGYHYSSPQQFSVWRWDVNTGETLFFGEGFRSQCADDAFRAAFGDASLLDLACSAP
jgi:WD40 repeat protein